MDKIFVIAESSSEIGEATTQLLESDSLLKPIDITGATKVSLQQVTENEF